MKHNICLLALLCLFFRGLSQGKAVAAGRLVPDILLTDVLNYQAGKQRQTELRLTDLKDKLVILDFWGTFCPPCLRLLPKYDSLQRELGDRVQFLLVSQEKKEKVAAFLKSSRYILPSVSADFLLTAMFPHTSIPHEVWIKDGRLLATTFGEAITKETILSVLNGGMPGTEQKEDNLAFDPLEPLLINGNGKGPVLYQSIITPYLPGLNSAAGFQRSPEKIIAVALNSSVLALYRLAFSNKDPLFDLDNRFLLEVPDTLKNKLDRGRQSTFHEWIKKYGFCYDLVLPPGYDGDIAELMQSDLNRFFGGYYHITASIEKRPVDCLALVRLPDSGSIETAGGEPKFSVPDRGLILKNLPIQHLLMELARRYSRLSTPVIDETGYLVPVDLTINADLNNIEALNPELLKAGLQLLPGKRIIDMVVIKTAPATQNNFTLKPKT